MNFGPGPVDISCYVVTNGNYAVTIPPNTIIRPGEFFVLAGQNVLPRGCGNIDSAVQVQLNWNTCNCTDKPVPTTGDGFFADGGSGNEKVILLDPALKAVDAVTRDAVPSSSQALTTATLTGGCSPKTFDLDTMTIRYEALGMSTGKENSFARTLDGDCEWVKDPPQSAHATNNRTGDKPSAIRYNFTVVSARDCDANRGSIDIFVDIVDTTVAAYNRTFPMNYTLAYDSDRNNRYELSDTYSYGVDSTPPSISVLGLPYGSYRVTVSSIYGCFLATYGFGILECFDVLPLQLNYFKLVRQEQEAYTFEWLLSSVGHLQRITLEKSGNGATFVTEATIQPAGLSGARVFTRMAPVQAGFSYYRLRLEDGKGNITYSSIINTRQAVVATGTISPNPVKNTLTLQCYAAAAQNARYAIYTIGSAVAASGTLALQKGSNTIFLPASRLAAGIYQLVIYSGAQPIQYRFVVQ
jgi:hypothetical protein